MLTYALCYVNDVSYMIQNEFTRRSATDPLELLHGKNERLQQSLSRFEAERGISGYRDTQTHMESVEATASGLDVQKGQTLEDMSGMVHQLSMKIAERKSRLAPIIKELRPLRQWFLSVVMISWGICPRAHTGRK